MAAGRSSDGYAIGVNAARATGIVDADARMLRARVKGALLVYPYAAYPSLTSSRGWGAQGFGGPKVFSVVGGKDQVVGWKYPQKALDRLKRDGLAVDTMFSIPTPPTPSTTTAPTTRAPGIGPTCSTRPRPISPRRRAPCGRSEPRRARATFPRRLWVGRLYARLAPTRGRSSMKLAPIARAALTLTLLPPALASSPAPRWPRRPIPPPKSTPPA